MFHPYSFYLQKHKNAKIKRESALPFSVSPYYSISLSIPPMSKPPFIMSHFAILDVPFCHLGYPISPFGMSHFTFWGIPFHLLGYPISPFGVSHFAIWDVPFRLLGYPILPFGVSHFAFWGIPFCLLGCPILPFGMSHFAIWGIPFRLLGCPILPFGMSHFTIWGTPFHHLGYIFGTFAHNVQPDFGLSSSFSLQKHVSFLSFRFIMFLRNSLGWIKYIL